MTAFITIGEQCIETTSLAVYLLCSHSCIEQELMLRVAPHYLSKYEDFRVGGITEELLDTKFDSVTLQDKFELPGVVGDITPT
eukprot:6303693-Ditylum_brightwellii.AAC.1